MNRSRAVGLAWLMYGAAAGAETWPAALSAVSSGGFVHVERVLASSSSLRVSWTPPEAAVHHYRVTASEPRSSPQTTAPGEAREAVLRGLKAGTSYAIRLRACLDPDCAASLDADRPAAAATQEEYWRIQGTGESYASAAHLVPDGNVGSYAFRYGPWAGPELDGRIQLYYAPLQPQEKGIKIGEMIAPRADSIEAASAFRGVSGFGLLRICQSPPSPSGGPPAPNPACAASRSLVTGVNLFQAVPLAPEAGGGVRLFFEAQGYDGRTRIHFLDSQDGYAGRDFHRGPPTRCESLEDYSPGGGCEPSLVIGVDIDGDRGNPAIRNARQFKIGYPLLDSRAWDMAPGTYMWFTTEWPDRRCSDYSFNAAYAVWNGSRWVVEHRSDGCPKLLEGVQAPAPVHIGGARYKLYFNRHPRPGGPTDPQVAFKPMRMIYADPETAGEASVVEFEDWEPLDSARPIHYLWANGRELSDEEQSRLDDYWIFAPDGDPSRLIMYSNMSAAAPGGMPFIGSAVLVNP